MVLRLKPYKILEMQLKKEEPEMEVPEEVEVTPAKKGSFWDKLK